MINGRENIHELIDAYLDGRLSKQQHARLLDLARQDSSVAAMMDAATRAEGSLHRSFTLPADVPLPSSIERSPTASGPPLRRPTHPPAAEKAGFLRGRPRWMYAAAAAILLAGVLAYMLNSGLGGSWLLPSTSARSGPTAAGVYAALKKKSFRPAFICENDEQFASFLAERFGHGAVIQRADNVRIVGWDYADGLLGEATAVILALSEGKNIVLFVDESRCKRSIAPPGNGMKMHRAVVNGLLFYEISDAAEPVVLPLIRPAPPILGGR